MKKIQLSKKEKIDIARKSILTLQEECDKQYKALQEDLDIEDSDWLFDYVFNTPDDDSYKQRVISELFEDDGNKE